MPARTFSLREGFGLLTVKEGAAELGIAERTLQRWIEDGKIPAACVNESKDGRRSVYLLRSLDVDAMRAEKVCERTGCGELFTPANMNQRYCCPRCEDRVRKARSRAVARR